MTVTRAPTKIPSPRFSSGRNLQHRLGHSRCLRSAVAVSIFRIAAVESSADLRLSGNGGRTLRHYLSGSRASSRTRLAPRRSWLDRQSSGTNRPGPTNLVRHVAQINDRLVSDERSNLVDSVCALSLRRVARTAVTEPRAVASEIKRTSARDCRPLVGLLTPLARLINQHTVSPGLAKQESGHRSNARSDYRSHYRINLTIVNRR